jgi:hypothetical protein
MDERDVVRDLVAKLIEAVEASLDGSAAVREALDELVRSGYEPRVILLADAAARADASDEDGDEAAEDDRRADVHAAADAAEAPGSRTSDARDAAEEDLEEAPDLRYELTKRDRDFLRMVRIRTEGG